MGRSFANQAPINESQPIPMIQQLPGSALTIYEWDADKVTGRQLKNAMDLMLVPESLRREAIELLRELRVVQRKANKKFSSIRNAAIAHRDPNALIQYRAIRDLKVNEVMEIGMEFFVVAERFINLLTRLMHAGNTLPSFLKQWSAAVGEQTGQPGPINNRP